MLNGDFPRVPPDRDTERSADRLAEDHTFVSYGSDYQILKDAALTGIEAFRAGAGSQK